MTACDHSLSRKAIRVVSYPQFRRNAARVRAVTQRLAEQDAAENAAQDKRINVKRGLWGDTHPCHLCGHFGYWHAGGKVLCRYHARERGLG